MTVQKFILRGGSQHGRVLHADPDEKDFHEVFRDGGEAYCAHPTKTEEGVRVAEMFRD